MNEEALLVGQHNHLTAVFTSSQLGVSKPKTAVLLLNSGLIHHAGPSRLYTKLAQALATKGLATIRFDLSGIGDSVSRPDNLSIYQIATQEPIEVMDYLQARGFEKFILAGICSGAYCAFKTALVDTRVIATVLINYQDDTANAELAEKAWSQRYWKNSIFRLNAWKNLFTGNANYKRLFSSLAKTVKPNKTSPTDTHNQMTNLQPSFDQEMDVLLSRNVSVLMLMSGLDISKEFLGVLMGKKLDWYKNHNQITFHTVEGADHLFTFLPHQKACIDYTSAWISKCK